MYPCNAKLAAAFLCILSTLTSTAIEPADLDLMQTTELLAKQISVIKFPESTLEKRIDALRAIATPLGIRLTISKGVEEKAKQWKYPALVLEGGSLATALKYTTARTQLIYSVRPGEVHLLLGSEMPHESETKKD